MTVVAAAAAVPVGIPPGLEFLLPTNRILIKQHVNISEVMTGIATNNLYDILDDSGRRIYLAAENSDWCSLCCFGECRSWNITLYDFKGRPVIQGNRDSTCCGSCGNYVQVLTASEVSLGKVIQNCECVSASWTVMDDIDNPILSIDAPGCSVCCPKSATCYEADFPVRTLQSGQEIGVISKRFGDLATEVLTAADTFKLEFPIDLDSKVKAVLIYATFLIDFMYYETIPERRRE